MGGLKIVSTKIPFSFLRGRPEASLDTPRASCVARGGFAMLRNSIHNSTNCSFQVLFARAAAPPKISGAPTVRLALLKALPRSRGPRALVRVQNNHPLPARPRSRSTASRAPRVTITEEPWSRPRALVRRPALADCPWPRRPRLVRHAALLPHAFGAPSARSRARGRLRQKNHFPPLWSGIVQSLCRSTHNTEG